LHVPLRVGGEIMPHTEWLVNRIRNRQAKKICKV